MTTTLRFFKLDNRWYADVPNHTLAENEMVAGSDDFLNACDSCTGNVIIEMDKNGQYIPFCTRMVFLKYYTPSAENQLHFWGQADRRAYVDAINEVLKEYLAEPITLEKEDE